MKTILFSLAIITLVSCAETDMSNDIVDQTQEDVQDNNLIDSTGYYEQSDNEAIYEMEMKKDMAYDFFYWYIENNETLMRKYNAVITVVDDFYAIDNTKLSEYLTYIEETGYFSQEFIDKEIIQWKEICGEEISKLREQNILAEGIPPCALEADPIFFVQDVVEKETIDKMEVSLNTINDSLYIMEYNGYECDIMYRNNKVQLLAWPSM